MTMSKTPGEIRKMSTELWDKKTTEIFLDVDKDNEIPNVSLWDKIKEEFPEFDDGVKVDRVGDWDEFAKHMHDYIGQFTTVKYGQGEDGDDFDLMKVTNPRECVWNIIKYGLRLYKDKGKTNDLEKICHYAQMAVTLSKGDLTKVGITTVKEGL